MSDTKVTVYMRWYVGDYLADTDHLSLEEHGAYSLLLMKMWQRDGSLPLDHDQLARICRVPRRRWDEIWPVIEGFFVKMAPPSAISQKRLIDELLRAKERCDRASQKGKKGGAGKHRSSPAQAEVKLQLNPSLTPAKAEAEPQLEHRHNPGLSTGLTGQGSGVRGQEESPSGRDPTEPEVKPRSKCTGDDLTRWYAQIRAQYVPGALPWVTPKSTEGSAESFAEKLTPEEVHDVVATMHLHFADLRDGRGKAGARENATFGFGCWRGDFSSLRERVHSPSPSAPLAGNGRPGPSPQVVASVTAMGERAAARYGD